MSIPADRAKLAGVAVFGAWLAGFVMLLLVTALYDRKPVDAVGVASLIAYGALFGAAWRGRERLIARLPLREPTLWRFLLVGWLAALVVELLLYFTFSYQHGIGVLLDIAYTTPTYVGLVFAWWLFLRRFEVSYREVFFLGGMHGWLVEAPQKVLSGQSPLSILLGTSLHVFIYGSFLLVPVAILGLATPKPDSPLGKKYAFALLAVPAVLVPAFALSILVLAVGKGL